MNIHRLGSSWFILFFVFMFFTGGCANNSNLSEQQSSTAAQTEDSNSDPAKISVFDVMKEDLDNWPDRLWHDSKTTFTKSENIAALLLAGGASIVMNQGTDEEIADYFDKYNKMHNRKGETLNVIGNPAAHFAASSLWYALSVQNQDSLNKERAWTMETALVINSLTTAALKTARNNKNPNGGDRSWPSGHTSSSFTVASVLDEFFGPKIGIPAYGIASLVAYRMMDTGDHWGSDIVFGAVLGLAVGHTVAGQNKDLEIAGFKVVPFIPQTEKSSVGIGLMKRF